MTTTTRIGCALLALAITAGATACTPAGGPTATSATTPAAPTATPATTASTATPSLEQQDITAAKNAVVKLWAVVDRLTNDPRAPIQDLDSVATGPALTMFQQNIVKYRAAHWVGSGASNVQDLKSSPVGSNAAGQRTWTVTACVDGSKTTLVDANGKSVQGPPYRIAHKSTVVERTSALFVEEDTAVGTC